MRVPGAPHRRAVDVISIDVERLRTGYLRYTTPAAPDFAVNVRPTAIDMARAQRAAMEAAANERAVDAYRDRRSQRPPTRPTGQVGADGRRVFRRSHDPLAYKLLPNGRLQSPGGLTYSPDSRLARGVLAARARAEQQSAGGEPA